MYLPGTESDFLHAFITKTKTTQLCIMQCMRKCAMFLLAIFGFTAVSLAQTVTGTVTDKKGEPIPGVTVTVKGTKNATSTNNQGVYSLSNVAGDAVLQFSGAGISRQEVPVSGRASVNAELETTVSSLNEVVVVGYGTSRKKDLTGSVASVKAKDFLQGTVATPDQLIQGKVPGVQITNNSGAPGGEVTIRIRGNNSVRAGNQPLIVVEGVPLDGRSARQGLRVVKHIPDMKDDFSSDRDAADNDYVMLRYADVLLIWAEAKLRKGDAATALSTVNTLRAVRGASNLGSINEAELLAERGRELYWESWRRNDLVRFGKFLQPYGPTKPGTSDPKYLIFPIPSTALAVNPNLQQNPGY